SDNGVGLPARARQGASGLGLRNMQERVEQLDGQFRILASAGKSTGTVIEVTVPLTHLLPPEETATTKDRARA
ncbi:MAG: histidine kinase, partial [Pseudomonadota bacterium]